MNARVGFFLFCLLEKSAALEYKGVEGRGKLRGSVGLKPDLGVDDRRVKTPGLGGAMIPCADLDIDVLLLWLQGCGLHWQK